MAYRHGEPVGLHHVSFAFASVDAGSGINYAGGWYEHVSGSDDFNPVVNLGTADNAYGAHVYFVAAAGVGGGDTTVRVTGTSWDPETGGRNPGATEDVVLSDSGALGAFYQTAKMWLGLVTIVKQAGPDLLCNYGYASFWHHGFSDFVLDSFFVEWQGDGNDAGTDVIFYHHDPTVVWTYAAGGEAVPPILYDMQTDYNTEFESNNNKFGSYQRAGLSDTILGGSHAGIVTALVQSGVVPFGIGTVVLDVRHP